MTRLPISIVLVVGVGALVALILAMLNVHGLISSIVLAVVSLLGTMVIMGAYYYSN